MNSHKIAFVGNSSSTMINFRLDVIKSIAKEGYEVVIIAPKDSEIKFLRKLSIRFIEITVDSKGTNPFKDIRLYRQLLAIYQEEQFDFIFHYTIKPIIYGSIAAKHTHTPQISIVTGIGYSFAHKNWLYNLSVMLHKHALKTVEEVWFLNEEDCNFFVKQHIVQQERVRVIPGEGVDTDRFIPRMKMPNKFSFIYCGRMLKSKGVELYVAAAEQLHPVFPDVKWKLLGPIESPTKDSISPREMENWVKDGHIQYLGVAKDVVPLLMDTSCLVLPSYYHEGIPRSLMEASSMQIPIITTDWVGCHDVVTHEKNGILCTPRDLEELIEAMRTMILTDSETLQKMGMEGRKIVLEKYDIHLIINIYSNYLKDYFSQKQSLD